MKRMMRGGEERGWRLRETKGTEGKRIKEPKQGGAQLHRRTQQEKGLSVSRYPKKAIFPFWQPEIV